MGQGQLEMLASSVEEQVDNHKSFDLSLDSALLSKPAERLWSKWLTSWLLREQTTPRPQKQTTLSNVMLDSFLNCEPTFCINSAVYISKWFHFYLKSYLKAFPNSLFSAWLLFSLIHEWSPSQFILPFFTFGLISCLRSTESLLRKFSHKQPSPLSNKIPSGGTFVT